MARAKQTAESKKDTVETETKEKQVKHAEVVAETSPVGAAADAEMEVEVIKAKAGKRSTKAVKEAEEKQAKQTRKVSPSKSSDAKPAPAKPVRSKAERAGKKYREAAKLIDRSKAYPLAEAMDLVVKTSTTKFDSSIELHVNLGVDPRQADQNVRGTLALPAGTGKSIRIAVLADGDDAAKAKAAGADIAGSEEIFAKLDKEDIDFDVLIATPAQMPNLGKYARLLGPRGLMPNPKSGTVSQNPAAAVQEAKAGRVEYRVDQAGIIHLSIGKASFGAPKLSQNAEAVLTSIKSSRPASIKGIYIKSIYVTSTMGPSIKMEAGA
jgi:large subunit ribosomal protein L1